MLEWEFSELVPHAGDMVLLQRVLHHDPLCTVGLCHWHAEHFLSDAEGNCPPALGLEIVSQVVAAHAGLLGRTHNLPPKLGFLIAVKHAEFLVPALPQGQDLRVTAQSIWRDDHFGVFSCQIEDPEQKALLKAQLSFFQP